VGGIDVSRDRPNVLLIVCDTLRPDYLGVYDGNIKTTTFGEFADAGALFERAYAAGPGSSISHAALFSGQYPSTSGVGGQVAIPEEVPMLAAHLRDAGYRTFGLPGPSRTGSHLGYDRGFDEYIEKWSDIPSSPSLEDLRQAVEDPSFLKPMPAEVVRLLRYGDDNYTSYLLDLFERKIRNLPEPYYAFLNLTTVHTPYDPPRPYKKQATPKLNRPRTGLGDMLGGKERLNRDDARLDRLREAQGHIGVPQFYEDQSYLRDVEIEILRAWYGASIRYLDDQLSATLRRLRADDLLENTVVVLTADHGEQFGQHGLLKHMYFHFQACLHVPLVIVGPGIESGQRREDFVSLIDVFPTVCELVDVELPSEIDGRSMFGPPEDRRSAVFAENGTRPLSDSFRENLSDESFERFSRGLKSVRTDDYLFTLDSAGDERLYELPEEQPVPLSTGPVDDLRTLVHDELGKSFPPGTESDVETSDEVESNLRRLGYIE
jgi:arylsulfatase A-like enzyme